MGDDWDVVICVVFDCFGNGVGFDFVDEVEDWGVFDY